VYIWAVNAGHVFETCLGYFINPLLKVVLGVLVFHEAFDRDRAIGFGFIWVALAIYASDGLWRSRRQAALAVT
jgi:chloramphenicol-sensitive protein RarD